MILDKKGMRDLAIKIADKLEGGEIIILVGDLAAGKTFLAQAIGEKLGAKSIKSPTFVILEIYKTKKLFQIAHFDFYRLLNQEIDFFEWSDYLGNSDYVSIVEWGEKIKPRLEKLNYFEIKIDSAKNKNKRKVCLSSNLRKWLQN
ncbi:MAG: tRNA (adenosine(37)-N6)-threonylcarbamoyltransferase complex ATPase subunit type 1 TsaE [Patescibacteria group bacterium]|nr:tRNA (adenosine(37)-N6)-threonylcarbamoyltransferase complex ATPase subunit type 1 TsaE [Patescibacteria group bacterium]